MDLLTNAKSNAEFAELETENLYVSHMQVNRAPKMRRRTYRAHGRIGPYMSSPCHVELFLSAKQETVKKAAGAKRSKGQSKLRSGSSGVATE